MDPRTLACGLQVLRPVILAFAIAVLASNVAATDFLRFIEDLPLAPGLIEDPSAGVIFDKPNGRIVRTRASGSGSSSSVIGFYRETLPQLGWRPIRSAAPRGNRVTDLRFVRARETLLVQVGAEGRDITVNFAITPR